MNPFEARARQIARRVPPEGLVGHPDADPPLWLRGWVRLRRWVLPTAVLLVALHLVGFRLVRTETVRLAAIAEEVVGPSVKYDERAARLRIKDRLALISGLERLLEPGAEPGLWPGVARALGLHENAAWEEQNRFDLLGRFIKFVSGLPEEKQASSLRLALLQSVPSVDILRIDAVRVIAELPPDLRSEIAMLPPGQFRALFAGLQRYRASEIQQKNLMDRVAAMNAAVDEKQRVLKIELARLDAVGNELDRAINTARGKQATAQGKNRRQ